MKRSLKGSLGNKKWFFYGIPAKTPFWNLYLLRVYVLQENTFSVYFLLKFHISFIVLRAIFYKY